MLKSKNLLNYYPFEGNANDAVGGNNFTVSGATLEAGKIGQGYNFDGVNDYIYSSTAINMGVNTSLCMWIDFSSPNATANYFLGMNSSAYGVRYSPGNPGTLLFLGPNATSQNYTTLKYNFPAYRVHLTMIRTTTRNVDWYINGEKIGSSDPGVTTSLPIKSIGRRASSNPYYSKCKMDEIAFFDESLSVPNIRRVMLGLHPL